MWMRTGKLRGCDLPRGQRVLVKLHVHAAAAEGDAFELKAEALLVGGLAA